MTEIASLLCSHSHKNYRWDVGPVEEEGETSGGKRSFTFSATASKRCSTSKLSPAQMRSMGDGEQAVQHVVHVKTFADTNAECGLGESTSRARHHVVRLLPDRING
jgi:hypothetical protein